MNSFKDEYLKEKEFWIGDFVWKYELSDEINGQRLSEKCRTGIKTCTLICAHCSKEFKQITPIQTLTHLLIDCPKCEVRHSVGYAYLKNSA